MTVKFGTTSSPANKINKTTNLGDDISCTVKQPCSVQSPYFIVKSSSVNLTDNYAQCKEYSRYYFIVSIEELPGGRRGVQCATDALMSFKDQIATLPLNVERGPKYDQFSALITDGNIATLAKMQTQRKNFIGGTLAKATGTGRNFILITT